MKRFRVLGVLHVFLGVGMLPLSLAFGVDVAPVLALGPLWVMLLGVLIWRRPGARVVAAARWTHVSGVVVGVFLMVHGVWALRMAAASAREGGGLLGGYGLLPLGFGAVVTTLSIVSLRLVRPELPDA